MNNTKPLFLSSSQKSLPPSQRGVYGDKRIPKLTNHQSYTTAVLVVPQEGKRWSNMYSSRRRKMMTKGGRSSSSSHISNTLPKKWELTPPLLLRSRLASQSLSSPFLPSPLPKRHGIAFLSKAKRIAYVCSPPLPPQDLVMEGGEQQPPQPQPLEEPTPLFVRFDRGGPSDPGHYKCLVKACRWERQGVTRKAAPQHVKKNHPREWADPLRHIRKQRFDKKSVDERRAAAAEKDRLHRRCLKEDMYAGAQGEWRGGNHWVIDDILKAGRGGSCDSMSLCFNVSVVCRITPQLGGVNILWTDLPLTSYPERSALQSPFMMCVQGISDFRAVLVRGTGKRVIVGTLDEMGRSSLEVALSFMAVNAPQLRQWMTGEPYSRRGLYSVDTDICLTLGDVTAPITGPSASSCAVVALAVVLGHAKLSCHVGVTGVVDLQGRLHKISGVMEKLAHAQKLGIERVVWCLRRT